MVVDGMEIKERLHRKIFISVADKGDLVGFQTNLKHLFLQVSVTI